MKLLTFLHHITGFFSRCVFQVTGGLLLMPLTLTASPGLAPDEGLVAKSAKPVASAFAPTIANQAPAPSPAPEGMVWIPGGEFSRGCLTPSEGHCTTATMNSVTDSQPIHRVYVDGFWMDKTDVTNDEFDKFVRATGYITIAEIAPTFGYAKNEALPAYCRKCPFLTDCWGECPKNRIIRTSEGEPGLNYLCRGFKQYFAHAIPEVDRIVADLRRRPIEPGRRM
jgi:radical SAM protein with 4Fe4S-binding SPASM domain